MIPLRATGAGSCRQCPVSCERVVHPAGCLSAGCPRLYVHGRGDDAWMGCMEGVFRPEVNVSRLRVIQRTAPGFGGLRAVREPLPMCHVEVQRTFAHRPGARCVNPEFLLSGAMDGDVVSTAGAGEAA